MKQYIKWTTASGATLLLLGLGWTCRQALIEWFAPQRAGRGPTEERRDTAYWTCPMHPSVKAEEGGPCPLCGMALQSVPKARGAAGETTASASPAPGTPGFIRLSAWQQQLIGVKSALGEQRPLRATLRTAGRVACDETRLADVNLKVSGWIQKLYVDYTGKNVERGQPLFALYSPELVSTQEEYLLTFSTLKELEAKGRQQRLAALQPDTETLPEGIDKTEDPAYMGWEASDRLRSLLESARQRLRLWDLSEAQIQELEKSGQPQTTATFCAPASGVVIEKTAVEGMYVERGLRLYRIADLDTVWVYAEVYEYELPLVQKGQQAAMELSYLPGETFQGEVDYVYPYLDAKTRTAKVRLRVPNPHLRLRLDMYAEVLLEVDAGVQLVVPESAVLFSGRRRLVFVDMGEGKFQPREVRLGVRLQDHYQVLEGLEAGERVVTSANFLLDSESKLKNALGGMASPDGL